MVAERNTVAVSYILTGSLKEGKNFVKWRLDSIYPGTEYSVGGVDYTFHGECFLVSGQLRLFTTSQFVVDLSNGYFLLC